MAATATPPPSNRERADDTAVSASATAASTLEVMDATPQPRRVPPRPPGAMARLADELAGPPDGGRQEAFESARKKFAMYGKQNAHVSHYSPDLQQQHQSRKRAVKGVKRKAAAVPVRRAVEWGDPESASPSTAVAALRNTVLLQENGELAAQLDEVEYHLDGILGGSNSAVETEERAYAMAASVVALTRLLQLEQVQTVIRVARQSRKLYARLREVLLRLKTYEHRMLKLAVSVMAFLLTMNAEADEIFTEDVIDAIVVVLKIEFKQLEMTNTSTKSGGLEDRIHPVERSSSEGKPQLKKSFLKRKKSTGTLARPMEPGIEEVSEQGDDETGGGDSLERARAHAQREEPLRAELRALLSGHDALMVDGQAQLSTTDVLCMLLHNILQIGGASGADDAENVSTQQHSRRLHQSQDLAGTTFATIMTRKKQLIRNGGLQLLLQVLETRFDHLFKDINTDLSHCSVSLEVTSAFQAVRTMLRVLDQASFLAAEVQRQMSKNELIFRVTLKLVEALSDLAWSFRSRKKWQSDPSFMHLVVDVLMSAMRVLINLSHQNEDANTHIAKLEGTNILFLAFCKLWGSAELERASHSSSSEHGLRMPLIAEDKVVYDAMLLLLSAITNCVEYSALNREHLSKLDLSAMPLEGLEAMRLSSACSLLVSFFVSKVQSYNHLFEMGDSQHEIEGETWVPEDVVLGGCTSLLLGCLMKDSSYNSAAILGALPDASPRLLLRALSAFVALHSQIGALTPEVGKSVLEVEKLLKSFGDDGGDPSSIPVQSLGMAVSTPAQSDLPSRDTQTRVVQAHITVKLDLSSRRRRQFEVEEINDADGEVSEGLSRRFPENQEVVTSPPASAFRFQQFSRVCSNVGDSDDFETEEDHSPVKKKQNASTGAVLYQSPARPKKSSVSFQSPARAKASSVIAQSPARTKTSSVLAHSPARPNEASGLAQSPARTKVSSVVSRSPARTKTSSVLAQSPARTKTLSVSAQSPARRKTPSVLAQSPARTKTSSVVSQSPARAKNSSTSSRSPAKAKTSSASSQSPARTEATSEMFRSPARSKTSANSTAVIAREVNAKAVSPARRVPVNASPDSNVEPNHQRVDVLVQRRLKRTRQFASSLEDELMRVESRVFSEVDSAARMPSKEDLRGDERAHSLEMFLSNKPKALHRTPPKAKADCLTKKAREAANIPLLDTPSKKPLHPPASARKPIEPPVLTHKRKVKAMPAKSMKNGTVEGGTDNVFDFPG